MEQHKKEKKAFLVTIRKLDETADKFDIIRAADMKDAESAAKKKYLPSYNVLAIVPVSYK